MNGEVFTITEGMFEVCIDGAIGSVCDIGWTDTDAAVVCRNIRNLEPPQYGKHVTHKQCIREISVLFDTIVI